ncbi:MAG: hypothetical protein K2X87_05740 [Gemmataceae bacterium]|nr:hypothetical protein [Gemmataceae bacterium]
MPARPVTLGLLVLVAAAAGHGSARPAADADPYTAFPKLVPPPAGRPGDGPPPALPKLVFPANATPLDKVRVAQVHEGESFLARVRARIELGQIDGPDFEEYYRVAAEVYKVKAELAPDAAGKVAAYEARVVAFKGWERFVEARVNAGTDRPQVLHLARFWRLGAEKELLLLQEGLAKAGKK